jgi:predicted O-methyltransferase YrrM
MDEHDASGDRQSRNGKSASPALAVIVMGATSVGMSAIYFATAIRDNGGGLVIGSELVQAKVDVARQNLTDAGLVE